MKVIFCDIYNIDLNIHLVYCIN